MLRSSMFMKFSHLPIVRVFSAFSASSLQPIPKNEKSINWTVSAQSTCVLTSRSFAKKASDSNAQKLGQEVKAEESLKNKVQVLVFPHIASLLADNAKKYKFSKGSTHKIQRLNKLANKESVRSISLMVDPYIASLLADIAHPKYGLFQWPLPVELVTAVVLYTYGVDHQERWGMTDGEYLVTSYAIDPDFDNFDCRKKYEMDFVMAGAMFKFMSPDESRRFSAEDIRRFYENMAVLAKENQLFYDDHKTKKPYGVCERYINTGPNSNIFKENLSHFRGRDIIHNLDDLKYFVEGPYGFAILFSWGGLADEGILFDITNSPRGDCDF